MALIDDIKAAVAKQQSGGYKDAGDAAIAGIDQADNTDTINNLNDLLGKYKTQEDADNQQIAAVPVKYQATLDNLGTQLGQAKTENQATADQNAVNEQTNLRRVLEQMANYGGTGGGQLPALRQQADTARKAADSAVYEKRATDITGLTTQKNQTNAQKQADITALQGAISTLEASGESALNTTISSQKLAHGQNVAAQQAAEQEAKAKALAAQQSAQPKPQSKAVSGGGSSGSSGSSAKQTDFGIGSTGEKVTKIQTILNDFGYGLSIDGAYGPKTSKAVAEFQKSHGVTATGMVDQATLNALQDALTALQESRAQTEGKREAAGRGHVEQ